MYYLIYDYYHVTVKSARYIFKRKIFIGFHAYNIMCDKISCIQNIKKSFNIYMVDSTHQMSK